MDPAVRSAIVRIARSCNRRDDFEQRVKQSLGEDLLDEALWLYDQSYKEIWGNTYPTPGLKVEAPVARKLESLLPKINIPLSALVIAVTATAELIAFLFPPYSIHFSSGYTGNLGFYFFFSPPDVGRIEVAVWGMEFLAILVIGALCLLFARSVQRSMENDERD